jgi:hypothetical protein
MADLAKIILMALMQDKPYPYESKLLAEREARGEARGYLKGLRAALIRLIDAKGLRLTADHFLQIETCEDKQQLRSWVRRAVFAETIDDILT